MFKKGIIVSFFSITAVCFSFSFSDKKGYNDLYLSSLNDLDASLSSLLGTISKATISSASDKERIKKEIAAARLKLKNIDFWIRYFEPVGYMKINGALPVEWENEVHEKFEPPYRREGAGLMLAEQYLDEENPVPDTLYSLIKQASDAVKIFTADSVTSRLTTYHHFFLCNRMYLLNLAAIYTTGFECPDAGNIIPELRSMSKGVKKIYQQYNEGFPSTQLSSRYLDYYDKMIAFLESQPEDFSAFDHFTFIKEYVNPLFAENQKLINAYSVVSRNYNDFTLSNDANSIFSKSLFEPENSKGIYSLVEDENTLTEIRRVGKLLFYDPILSGNNKRSCASCHKPTEYFTDTTNKTALQFDERQYLPRNTTSLINSVFNHLVMVDGKHISLQGQARDVITNPIEMGCTEKEAVEKVMSVQEYKKAFKSFLKFTPEEKKISINHIISAITFYYKDFSNYYSPFDDAMNDSKPLDADVKDGFNLFMSKAQCATCHFVPHFNGIKPPYISSEFEVLGVPADTLFKKLSADKGRYNVNPAPETMNAFRTGTVRNAEHTKPYMHNGVFTTLEQVIDFYNNGGGVGKKLNVPNQTLPPESLDLTKEDVRKLLAFIHSLKENIIFDKQPDRLPVSQNKKLNERKIGGEY